MVSRGRMKIQESHGPGGRKPILLPVSKERLPTPGTRSSGLPGSHQSDECSLLELTSPEDKVERLKEENYSNWEEICCSSEPKVNPNTCPSIERD